MTAKKSGFTLIELLVAITIIAVLSSIGFTIFSGTQSKARDSRRKQDLQTIATALELYQQKNNFYVKTASPQDCTNTQNSDTLYSAIGSYISNGQVPTDPLNTTEKYCYFSQDTTGGSFRLYAKLESCDSDALPGCIPKTYNFSIVSPDLYFIALTPQGTLPTSVPTATPTPTPTPTPIPCTNGYKDNDKDGYGAGTLGCYASSTSYNIVANNTDCYDSNANAHPGQMTDFSVNRGDGSYDYNCDGSITYAYTILCSATTSGPFGSIPACGATFNFYQSVPCTNPTPVSQRCK